jgi:CheY-like chemotaxis protein
MVQAAQVLQDRRILVVDNEPDILLSMTALLEQWQCQVYAATDFTGALRVLRDVPPEIILADLHLDNGKNGLDVVAQLRHYFAEDIPAVLVTADHSDELGALRKQLDVPVLNKPVRPSKLRAILSQRLGAVPV